MKQYLIVICVVLLAICGGCISERPGVDAPTDIVHFPLGVAVHPSGRYAAIVNSNFNQAYKNGSVVIVDLTTYRIVPDWTVPVGTFPGEVIFNHAGTRMYVAVRGELIAQGSYKDEPGDVLIAYDVDMTVAGQSPGDDPFLIEDSRQVVNVAPDPFGLAVDADDYYLYVTHISSGELSMLEESPGRLTNTADEAKVTSGETIRRCIPENLYCPSTAQYGSYCGECDFDNANCSSDAVVVPTEVGGLPFEMENSCLEDIRRPGRSYCAYFCEVDNTVVNDAGETVRIGCPEGYRCQTVEPLHVEMERKLSSGGNQAAISPLTGSVYVSHRDSNLLGVVRPYWIDGIGLRTRVQQIVLGGGYDLRGMSFNADGSKLFVAARNIDYDDIDRPGVYILDTSLKHEGCSDSEFIGNTTSCELNQKIDFIDVGNEPANVALINDVLYVALFEDDLLYAINTSTRQVMDTVNLAPENFIREPGIFREHARPYDIATYSNAAGLWALVSNFQAHEVAVVHLFDQYDNPINRVERKIENRAKLYAEDQY